MKRSALASIAILVLLFSALAGTVIVNLVQSNPIAPSDIEVYSPQNQVYYLNEIEIGFIAPSRYIYPRINFASFSYSLDGQAKVPISGNTTVTGLSWGSHSLVVYGEDTDGNTRSSWTVHFDIFPIAWVVTVIAASAVLGMGLLVYFKKRKR